MITEIFDKDSHFASQRVRYRTVLYGKEYFWLTDTDGTWYLLRSDEERNPTFA